jgi:hypothetical protein
MANEETFRSTPHPLNRPCLDQKLASKNEMVSPAVISLRHENRRNKSICPEVSVKHRATGRLQIPFQSRNCVEMLLPRTSRRNFANWASSGLRALRNTGRHVCLIVISIVLSSARRYCY